MIKFFFSIIIIFIITLNANEEIKQKPFEEIIIGYNHGFVKAMQNAKFDHLEEYLTQEVYYKTFIWIDSFQSNGYFMDSVFLDIKYEEFETTQYSASLVTREQWKYRYIDIKTNEVVKRPHLVDYKMKYFFVLLEDGSWKINHIKILDEKEEEIKE